MIDGNFSLKLSTHRAAIMQNFLVKLFIICFILSSHNVAATDYFVLPYTEANPNGDGMSAERASSALSTGAWNGIRNIKWSDIKAGDSIKLKRGEVYFGMLDISKSGTENKPIRFSVYGSNSAPNPVITGGKELSHNASHWRKIDGAVKAWGGLKFLDGTAIRGVYNAATVDGAGLLIAGSSDFSHYLGDFSSGIFKASLFTDDKPWNHTIFLAILPYNVNVNSQSFIEFTDIDFILGNGWKNPQHGNITVTNSDHISFNNCTVRNSAFSGFWVKNSDYITINNCKIYENSATGLYFRDGSSYATISNNKIYRNGKYTTFTSRTDTGGLLMGSSGIGKGHLIEYNEIYDNSRNTVTERVDGLRPDNLAWKKAGQNIWKKDLGVLLRWGGSTIVAHLGIDKVPMPSSYAVSNLSANEIWYWDKSNETLYLYSIADPNNYTKPIEISRDNGSDPAISLWGIQDSVIRNNNVHDNFSSGIGAFYKTSKNISIIDNVVTNNLKNNSLLHSGGRYAIGISGKSSNKVKNNTVVNNKGDGIAIYYSLLSPSDDIVVAGNNIGSNSGYQLAWYNKEENLRLKNVTSNNNVIKGNKLFYYLDKSYKSIAEYSSASKFDTKTTVIDSYACR